MAGLKPSTAELLNRRLFEISVSRTVAASRKEIWAVISDESTWLNWYRPLHAFSVVGSQDLGLGCQVVEHESFWKTTSTVAEWRECEVLGLSTEDINFPGLFAEYYRQISLVEVDGRSSLTKVSISGAFSLGTLGWFLFPYTYPQAMASLYFEYRSALVGLNEFMLLV